MSLVLLIIPAVNSVYTVPSAPAMYFPCVFLVYLLTKALWMRLLPYRKPVTPALIRADLDPAHTRNASI